MFVLLLSAVMFFILLSSITVLDLLVISSYKNSMLLSCSTMEEDVQMKYWSIVGRYQWLIILTHRVNNINKK
jgi:hypothetical protein